MPWNTCNRLSGEALRTYHGFPPAEAATDYCDCGSITTLRTEY
jgi:hypothetical protein